MKFLLPNPIIIAMNLGQYSTQSINATNVIRFVFQQRKKCKGSI